MCLRLAEAVRVPPIIDRDRELVVPHAAVPPLVFG